MTDSLSILSFAERIAALSSPSDLFNLNLEITESNLKNSAPLFDKYQTEEDMMERYTIGRQIEARTKKMVEEGSLLKERVVELWPTAEDAINASELFNDRKRGYDFVRFWAFAKADVETKNRPH